MFCIINYLLKHIKLLNAIREELCQISKCFQILIIDDYSVQVVLCVCVCARFVFLSTDLWTGLREVRFCHIF